MKKKMIMKFYTKKLKKKIIGNYWCNEDLESDLKIEIIELKQSLNIFYKNIELFSIFT